MTATTKVSPNVETDDFRSLLTWFRELADEICNTGTPAEITSGLACVHHRPAEVTKDCDIWILPTSLAAFKHLVLTRQWQGNQAVYRSAGCALGVSTIGRGFPRLQLSLTIKLQVSHHWPAIRK
jgi:hypothetical protein